MAKNPTPEEETKAEAPAAAEAPQKVKIDLKHDHTYWGKIYLRGTVEVDHETAKALKESEARVDESRRKRDEALAKVQTVPNPAGPQLPPLEPEESMGSV